MRLRSAGGMALAVALVLSGCDGDETESEAVAEAPSDPAPATADAAPVTEEAAAESAEATSEAPEPAETEEPTETEEATTDEEEPDDEDAAAEEPEQAPAATPAPPGLPRSSEEYADAWVRAWGLGDDDEMARYADRYVHGQYSGTAGGGTWVRKESGPYEDGLVFVTYEDSRTGAGLFLLVAPNLVEIGAQHGLISVAQLPPSSGAPGLGDAAPPEEGTPAGLTTDIAEYADIWVRAWGAGNYERADVYGSTQAMYLFEIDPVGGGDWARVGVSGTEVRYRDGGGNTLVLQLDGARVAAGATDGVLTAYLD